MGTENKLSTLLNASGFLFQMRIAEEIRSTTSRHSWRVLAEEHPWERPKGDPGFIDIVAEQGNLRLVIECKRVLDGTWVFMVPNRGGNEQQRVRILYTSKGIGDPPVTEWREGVLDPMSPEAPFCVVRGQGDRDTPMLERLASLVVDSAESFANQELRTIPKPKPPEQRIYIPAIVTNASIVVSNVDPKSVTLERGQLPDGAAAFQEEDLVRFRKALGTSVPEGRFSGIEEAHSDSERTTLIIQSRALGRVLLSLRFFTVDKS